MARGKSQFCTWFCSECGAPKEITAYNKKRNDEITKELKKHCRQCRKHQVFKRKDTKKASNN